MSAKKDLGKTEQTTEQQEIASSAVNTVGEAQVDTKAAPPKSSGPIESPAAPDSPAGVASVKAADKTLSRIPAIDGYVIEAILGRGGMGIVYRAHDTNLDRKVALKTLLLAKNSAAARQRIETEAKSLATISNPNVVQIHDFGLYEDAGAKAPTPYLVMELVDGQSLDKFNDGNPLKPKQAAEIVYQLAKALCHCHERGVVHRDIKPANILMASSSEPKLTDFGLARIVDEKSRLTQTGEIMGTPAYMAPEQASGVVKNIGPAADIYGLGAVLYHLLTGRPPFMAPDAVQTMMKVLTEDPTPPTTIQKKLPKDLETITLKCLEKKSKHRYESCEELADDLKRFLRNQPISAKPAPTSRKVSMWIQRHPALSALIGLATVGIVAAVMGTAFHVNSLKNELERSERIILEGRQLSKWLLNDFTTVIESQQGTTYARGELADRTQTYLNALLKESADDESLKTDLAFAFARLAEIQGQADAFSLGQTQLAEENIEKSERLLNSLSNKDSEEARSIRLLLHSMRAAKALDFNDRKSAESHLDSMEQLLALLKVEHDFDDSKEAVAASQIDLMRFNIAQSSGNEDESKARLAALENRKLQISADGSPEQAILSIVRCVQANSAYLDPKQEYEKLRKYVDSARTEIERISSLHPEIPVDLYLASIQSQLGTTCFRTAEFEESVKYYKQSLESWQRQCVRDAGNHIALFNVAVQWQNIGETLVAMEKLDETNAAYDEAAIFYRKWAKQRELDLSVQLSWLQFEDSRARLYTAQGKLELARQSINQVIAGMSALGQSNAQHRRSAGDAKLTAAFIEALECSKQIGLAAEGKTHRFYEQSDLAVQKFQDVVDHFDAMDTEGIGSEATRSQANSAKIMADELKGQRKKMQELDESGV